MLKYGADTSASASIVKNQSQAIHVAAERSWKRMMVHLLENGANPNVLKLIERRWYR